MQTAYEKIAARVEERIAAGEFSAGGPIPSVRALAAEYGVAPLTARRAISRLCQSGRVRTVNGLGTFVTQGCPLRNVALLTNYASYEAVGDMGRVLTNTLAGAQGACSEAGVSLVVATERDDPGRFLGAGNGFIVLPPYYNSPDLDTWIAALRDSRDPAVSVVFDVGLGNFIVRDTDAGVAKGLRYLHGLGHRRVTILTRLSWAGPPVLCVPPDFHAPGLEVRLHVIEYKSLSPVVRMRQDYEALDAIFGASWTPTALLAGTGVVVDNAMQYLDDRGVRVPGEVSVMGYCMEAHGRWDGRPITRLDLAHHAIGAMCVQELIKMARGGGYKTGHVTVNPELVHGDTCAAAPAVPVSISRSAPAGRTWLEKMDAEG